jgi:hypothetical protein
MPDMQVVEALPTEATLQCPLMSLPRAFATSLDAIPPAPVWQADDARRAMWRARLGASDRPRIGFAWRGSAGHGNDRNRSLPLRAFLAVIDESAAWFGIQKGMPATDHEALSAAPKLRIFDAEIKDFEDTAALIAELDLIITVDTSLAHLAGSMGRNCWVLLPFNPDWRWLLDREDSPWYPSIRLFRQKHLGDWAGLLEELRSALSARVW